MCAADDMDLLLLIALFSTFLKRYGRFSIILSGQTAQADGWFLQIAAERIDQPWCTWHMRNQRAVQPDDEHADWRAFHAQRQPPSRASHWPALHQMQAQGPLGQVWLPFAHQRMAMELRSGSADLEFAGLADCDAAGGTSGWFAMR